jgi:hypothetical protein
MTSSKNMNKLKPVVKHSNFRVVIEPRGLGDYGFACMSPRLIYGDGPEAEKRMEQEIRDRCQSIIDDVKRHVDGVGYVSMEHDTQEFCPFCGWNWDSACDENSEPGCCQAAIDAHATLQTA